MDGLLGNLFGIQEEDPLLRLLPPEQRQLLMNQAREQGTTNLGLALLQAGGPTTVPGGFGQRLGQAGMQAMQANQGLMDKGLERLMAARKLQQEQAQLLRKEEFRNALPGLFKTQTVEQMDAYGRPGAGEVRPPETTTAFDQNAAMRLAMQYPEFAKDYFGGVSSVRDLFKPVTEKIGEGETLYDVRTGKPIAQGTPKSKFKPGDTRDYIQGNQKITQEFQTDGTWKTIAAGAAFAPPSQVNVNMPTESERTAGFLTNRLQAGIDQLQTAIGQNPSAQTPKIGAEAVKFVTGSDYLKNLMNPASRQQVEAAQLEILDSALTLGTGAAYTREQLMNYQKSYFPQLGDKPSTIADKQKRLETLLESARIKSGRAAPQTSGLPSGVTVRKVQ